MYKTFEPGVMPALDLTSRIVELVDPELFSMIEEMGGQPFFTLSWLLTWFSHDIAEFEKVQLIFDACLATHPLFCTYITVAQIVLSKNALIEYGDASVSGFEVFKQAKMFKIEESIALAYEYYQKWSPNDVLETIRKENMGKPKWTRKIFGSDSPM